MHSRHSWPLHSRPPRTRSLAAVFAMAISLFVITPAPAIAAGDQIVAPTPDVEVDQQSVPSASVAEVAAAEESVPATTGTLVAELGSERTDDYGMVGVTWENSPNVGKLTIQVRVRVADRWSTWRELHIDPHTNGDNGGRDGTEPMWVGSADGVGVRVFSTGGSKPAGLQVATIDPGETNIATATPAAFETASVAQPAIITRDRWGAGPGTHCNSPQVLPATHGAVIHHTAGTNSYTPEKAYDIVRATQAYHVKSRNWCDIGYNFLIDQYGQIFEGRRGGITKQVRGAHAGNGAVNEQAMGVSMMGNFDEATPTAAMKASTVKLVAWRFAAYDVPAKGTYRVGGLTLDRISGHRDVKSTACPGANVYRWVTAAGGLRDDVSEALGTAQASDTPSLKRLAGDNRYETASAIAAGTLPSANTVFLSSGTMYADALSAGPAAAKAGAPIALTRRDALPPATDAMLQKIDPRTIYVLGGTGAVSAALQSKVAGSGAKVVRLAGGDRYETGASISSKFWPSGAGTVYIASGRNFPDALSGGALAAHNDAPILLSQTTYLPPSVFKELKRLDPAKVVLLGGRASLTYDVTADVKKAVPGVSVIRLGGADRYETSAEIVANGWSSSKRAFYATGLEFADALAGVPAAAASDAPLLLTRKSCMPESIADRSARLAVQTRTILGGTGVLANSGVTAECVKPAEPNEITVPSDGRVNLAGHGFGHGIGMSQYGAYGGAQRGASYSYILNHYYPGTKFATKTGSIRVLLTADTTSTVTVNARSGLSFKNLASGQVKKLPTKVGSSTVTRWRIIPIHADPTKSVLQFRDTSWHTYDSTVFTGDAQFDASGPITLIMPDESGRSYRGALRSARPSSGSTDRNTVNVLSIEDYVRGVVAAEMPSSWPSEALKAQAVAARTYGVRDISRTGYYDICDTTACQVYGGVARETSNTDAAIRATAGKILTYKGEPAFTQFSSSSGGYTAKGSMPYLPAAPDPWDSTSANPVHNWHKTINEEQFEDTYPSIGDLRKITITKRNGHGAWGGRVVSMTLTGSAGSRSISGNDARRVLNLRSNWFSFS